jgi:dihydrofolate reductase
MIRAIMAADDKGGVSKNGSMPWPKNSSDLQWFKKQTLNNVVIMGRLTWIDPFMSAPLKNRVNVLATNQSHITYLGVDEFISGDLIAKVKDLSKKYKEKDIYIIGGPKILDQLFELIEEFYLTRIYGNFECDKSIEFEKIKQSMTIKDKIENDETCHFEIWKR